MKIIIYVAKIKTRKTQFYDIINQGYWIIKNVYLNRSCDRSVAGALD